MAARQPPPKAKSHEQPATAHRYSFSCMLSRAQRLLAPLNMTVGRNKKSRRDLLLCGLALMLQACLSKVTLFQAPDAGAASSQAGHAAASPPGAAGDSGRLAHAAAGSWPGAADTAAELAATCVNGGRCEMVDTTVVDKLDLLLVIDDSSSMGSKQAALIAQFPRLFGALATGLRGPNDARPFPPVTDIHLGVVSGDIGVPGVTGIAGCDPNGGDDGLLQHGARGMTCKASYPPFLAYQGAQWASELAADGACLAALGSQGCGFQAPLEAALKAVWPVFYTDSANNVVMPNPITFLATTPSDTSGHGDVPGSQGGSLGFLRSDPAFAPSLFAILLLTDADDCSAHNTELFESASQLPVGSPYLSADINLRCHAFPTQLNDVANRYAQSLKALRSRYVERTFFAGIAGVPLDAVGASALAAVDFSDATQRDAYYDSVLAHPDMEERVDPASNPGHGTGQLLPSCTWLDAQGQAATAQPPRRIVEMAKAVGQNSVIQSICQADLGPAVDQILNGLVMQLGAQCLGAPLPRTAQGSVDCDVIWELPSLGAGANSTPTQCSERLFLKTPTGKRKAQNARGGQNCLVQQLGVSDPASQVPAWNEGWYYDDFSPDIARTCRDPAMQRQRIAFTPAAQPPLDVRVVLDCHTP